MKPPKRSLRIHHRGRIKTKAARIKKKENVLRALKEISAWVERHARDPKLDH